MKLSVSVFIDSEHYTFNISISYWHFINLLKEKFKMLEIVLTGYFTVLLIFACFGVNKVPFNYPPNYLKLLGLSKKETEISTWSQVFRMSVSFEILWSLFHWAHVVLWVCRGGYLTKEKTQPWTCAQEEIFYKEPERLECSNFSLNLS